MNRRSWPPCSVLSLMLALTVGGCSREPAVSSPPPQSAPATPAGGPAVVSGTASPSAVVTLAPTTPRDMPLPAESRAMDQVGLQFMPGLLVARVGQKVEFRNSEDVLHNVRVGKEASQTTEFNVATPPFETYTHTFAEPGDYKVSCDVHPAMRASIYVAAAPYAVVAGDDGRFTFPAVEPGSYTLTVLAGGRRADRIVTITSPRTELSK